MSSIYHTRNLPLINECPQSWVFKIGELQFVSEQRVGLDQLFKLWKHHRSGGFCIPVLGELLIFPSRKRRTLKADFSIDKLTKLPVITIQQDYLKFSNVSSWVISLNRSSLKAAKTLRSFMSISTAFARSFLWSRNPNISRLKSIKHLWGRKFSTGK